MKKFSIICNLDIPKYFNVSVIEQVPLNGASVSINTYLSDYINIENNYIFSYSGRNIEFKNINFKENSFDASIWRIKYTYSEKY